MMNLLEQWIIQILYDSNSVVIVSDICDETYYNCNVINGHISILKKKGLVQSCKRSGMTILSLTDYGNQIAEKIYGGGLNGTVV